MGENHTPERLLMLSIKELIELDVTKVSGWVEPMAATPAAIHFITAEDIRRSGAASMPDTLRLAAGMHRALSASSDHREFGTTRAVGRPFYGKLTWNL